MHDDKPFTVVGILAATGTPVDQTLHVSLQGIEAIHSDWLPTDSSVKPAELMPKSITAFMLGLNSKMTTFQLQREINDYNKEPLAAILPGVALSELWQMMRVLESTLHLVSILVFFAACLGVSAMLLASIRERRREIHLLRVIGASPYFLFMLIELEAILITLLSCILGTGLLTICLSVLHDYLISSYGLNITTNLFTPNNLYLLGAISCLSAIVACIPAVSGYRQAKQMNS